MNKDINNNININVDYKNNKLIGPFKFFALTNFPYIEQTFDSLTNYQLLCEIVKYLNKVIESTNTSNQNVNTLYQAFLSLQTALNNVLDQYQNNYNEFKTNITTEFNNLSSEFTSFKSEVNNSIEQGFSNLNIQDEINNKLDIMASDGTLAEIINQDLFDSLNQLIIKTNKQTNLYTGTECVLLGDQMSITQYTNWVSKLATKLGCTIHNMAQANATFTKGELATQLSSSELQVTNPNNVKLVIIYAGANDISNFELTDNIISSANTLISSIENKYPNAKIYTFIDYYSYGDIYLGDDYYIKEINANINSNICNNTIYYLAGRSNLLNMEYASTYNRYYPNDSGDEYLANQIYNRIINNKDYSFIGSETYTNITRKYLNDSSYFQFTAENGIVNFILNLNFKSKPTEEVLTINMNEFVENYGFWWKPYNDEVTYFDIGFVTISNDIIINLYANTTPAFNTDFKVKLTYNLNASSYSSQS